MVMPELRCHQREKGDGEQHACKRDTTPQGQDFPEVGSLEDSYFTVARRAGDALRVEREPVEFSIVRPGESLI